MSSAYPDSEKEDSDKGPVNEVTKEEIEKQALLAKAAAYLESLLESSGSSSDEEVIEATTVIVQYEEDEEVELDNNIYSLTIAALMNDKDGSFVTWREKMYGIRMSIYCFVF